MKKRFNESLVVETLLNKMFEISGHEVRYADIVKRKDNWYQEYTMTREQNVEWNKWGVEYMKKEFKMYAGFAERQMTMIDLMWGLKIEE
jgi:hypothetical protein